MRYTVYIVECSDRTLYTGIARDVLKRVREHNEGKTGAKYTRSRRPVTLKHQETFNSKGKALSREHAIKTLSRTEKKRLYKKGVKEARSRGVLYNV